MKFVLSILIFTICNLACTVAKSATVNDLPKPILQNVDNLEDLDLDVHDFDGDGQPDNINFEFTMGSHCCYIPQITLSSTQKTYKFPFNMDGGYFERLDRRPDQFDIRDIDNDGKMEILMRIETYNYSFYPIPEKWQKKYGFKTNFTVFDFEKERLNIKDQDSYGDLIAIVGMRKSWKSINQFDIDSKESAVILSSFIKTMQRKDYQQASKFASKEMQEFYLEHLGHYKKVRFEPEIPGNLDDYLHRRIILFALTASEPNEKGMKKEQTIHLEVSFGNGKAILQ